tara:strand:- start:1182 stop:1727 length:546 start_codon:yes stop_codon:yes gene_type:complete
MSTLETNLIQPSTGTSLTIGASGDTITIPSGATITNSGTATGFAGTGRIIQTVQVKDESSLSSSSTSYVDTGLSASITPGATSSKILVLVSMGVFGADAAGSAGATIKLLRDSTDLILHSSLGAHPTITYLYTAGTSFSFLDSPSSTSSVTYKTQFKSNGGENFVTDNASAATITLLEISQ